jgi:hypothetical protein
LIETELYFPTNTYEMFAYAVESRSYALGATANVNGFIPLNLADQTIDSPIWPPDPYENSYKDHPWHSAEFLFSSAEQWNFWNKMMLQFGFMPITP